MRRQLLTFVIVDNGSKTERQRTVDHPSFDRQALQAYWPGRAWPGLAGPGPRMSAAAPPRNNSAPVPRRTNDRHRLE